MKKTDVIHEASESSPTQSGLSFPPSNSALLPSIQHIFFHWHWIKSKNCSLWNEVGLVRTFRIQSQHSWDFQVCSMPKSPPILRNMERTDNLSMPRATLLHLGRFSEWLQGVGVNRIYKQYDLCELWNAANPSTGDSQTRPQQTCMAGGVKRTPATQTCGQQNRR